MTRRDNHTGALVGKRVFPFFFVPLVPFAPFVLKSPTPQSAGLKHTRPKPISLDKPPHAADTARILSGPPDPVLTVLADIPALARTDEGGRAARRARPQA